jgi:hypothetical protein
MVKMVVGRIEHEDSEELNTHEDGFGVYLILAPRHNQSVQDAADMSQFHIQLGFELM